MEKRESEKDREEKEASLSGSLMATAPGISTLSGTCKLRRPYFVKKTLSRKTDFFVFVCFSTILTLFKQCLQITMIYLNKNRRNVPFQSFIQQ